MSPVFRFATAFVLGILGMTFTPHHACHLSSPFLLALLVVLCLVVLPLVASRTRKLWLVWTISAAAPFVGFAALFFYGQVLHWQHFPSWLMQEEAPRRSAAQMQATAWME